MRNDSGGQLMLLRAVAAICEKGRFLTPSEVDAEIERFLHPQPTAAEMELDRLHTEVG